MRWRAVLACIASTYGLAPPQRAPPPPLRAGYAITSTLRTSLLAGETRVPDALRELNGTRFPTASKAKRACRRGEVMVNGRTARCGDAVGPADTLELRKRVAVESYVQERFASAAAPFDLPVAYEDDFLAVVVKPAGAPTYSAGGGRHNLRSCLPFALRPPASCAEGDEVLRRPQPVHRLDKATSGLVLCAKTKRASVELSRAFAERRVKKRYAAVLVGAPGRARGVVDAPVPVNVEGREVVKAATTFYAVERTARSLRGELALVAFAPRTGRTHQLRRHAAHALGCPIAGDALYGAAAPNASSFLQSGLFLCAVSLALDHPITGARLRVAIPLPGKFASLLDREERRADALGG